MELRRVGREKSATKEAVEILREVCDSILLIDFNFNRLNWRSIQSKVRLL